MTKIMTDRLHTIQNEIMQITTRLKEAPAGTLVIHRNGSGFKYFKQIKDPASGKINRTYLSRKNKNVICGLAEKNMLLYRLRDLKQEERAVVSYLARCPKEMNRLYQLFSKAGWANLLNRDNRLYESVQSWADAPYEKKAFRPEDSRIKTARGEEVRSKSEALIAMALFQHHIPYRYECRLTVGGTEIFPDFTLLHPPTGTILIWEHFGLIDDPSYLSSAMSKIRLYIKNGWIPTDRLIMTFETADCPLDSSYIESLVKHYFPDE